MATKEELEYQVRELEEKVYALDPKSRPTIMKTIEDKEASLLSTLQWQIEQLEKETGRKFPYDIIKMITVADLEFPHTETFKCRIGWCPYKIACEE